MSGQFSSAHLVQIFTQARCLQIKRIEKVFAEGHRLPKEVCKNYTRLYREKCQGCKGEEGAVIHQNIFIAFWTEVRKLIAIPEDLNRLDLITLFGEIATGERLASGALACRGARVTDPAALWKHAAADRRTALADRIAGVSGQANRSKERGTERCMRNRSK